MLSYILNVMQQSACLEHSQIEVDTFAVLYNCTTVDGASDSMMARSKAIHDSVCSLTKKSNLAMNNPWCKSLSVTLIITHYIRSVASNKKFQYIYSNHIQMTSQNLYFITELNRSKCNLTSIFMHILILII